MPYYQDTAGTVLATAPGQSIARISRISGTVDATQATAGARPTLARWPKGGRRNYMPRNDWGFVATGAVTANLYSNNLMFSPGSLPSQGVAVTCIARGSVEGVPYIDFRINGTNTGANGFVRTRSESAWLVAGSITISAECTLISGSSSGVTCSAGGQVFAAGPTFVRSFGSTARAITTSDAPFVASEVIAAPTEVSTNYYGITITVAAGATVDATIRITALQAEAGSIITPTQAVISSNEISEEGKPDVFHLWNDGGDSMPAAAVPAGTYGLSYVDVLGTVTHTTATSDGTTPINLLRTERQVDVVMRAGAFTATEKAKLTSYWGYLK